MIITLNFTKEQIQDYAAYCGYVTHTDNGTTNPESAEDFVKRTEKEYLLNRFTSRLVSEIEKASEEAKSTQIEQVKAQIEEGITVE